MSLEPIVRYSRNVEGKITIATVFLCFLAVTAFFFFDVQYKDGIMASDVATTSVVVLNSPPEWSVDPYEDPASTASNPTNEGGTVTWKATAYDPNGSNDYWLLICKNDAGLGDKEDNMTLYDPNILGSVPDCHLGETWAISALTADGMEATATFEVPEGRSESEVNDWYAFICDNDEINPRCNTEDIRQGVGDSGSPFYVNYRPYFTQFTSPSPTDPGGVATWTTVAYDPNTQTAAQEVRLFVCRENDFNEETEQCGPGGTYASSSPTANNPSANHTVVIPTPNDVYEAYGFIVDAYGLSAPLSTNSAYDPEDRMQGTNASLTVNNVAPQLLTSSVSYKQGTSTEYYSVYVDEGETDDFEVQFITEDNNSCVTSSWSEGDNVSNHAEMTAVEVNIYRSGVGMNNCVTDGHYNPNNCYPFAVEEASYEAAGGWNMVCVRDDTTCSGNEDTTVTWDCTFPLWYLADPTDGATINEVQFPGEEWVASVTAMDTDSATGTLAQADSGIDLNRFAYFRLDQNSIGFGELEAGQSNSELSNGTPIVATGNTGMDQELQGTPMCPDFDVFAPNFGCSTYDYLVAEDVPQDTIPARFQQFAEGTATLYGSGTALTDVNEGTFGYFALNVPKPTTVGSPATKTIGWGIEIPSQITIAGEYRGENTFQGVYSDATNW